MHTRRALVLTQIHYILFFFINFQKTGADIPPIQFAKADILIIEGNLRQAVKLLNEILEVFLKDGSLWYYITTEQMLGDIYLQAVLEEDLYSGPRP